MAAGVAIGGGAGAGGAGIPRVKISLMNLPKVLREMENLREIVIKTAIKATEEELEKLLADAQALTPVDTGRLQESGRIFKPRKGAGLSINFQVVFGAITVRGRYVDYALIVHETHRTMSGFLSKAAAKHLPELADRVAAKVTRAMK